MSSVVVDAVEHLVRGIVDNPDDVRVDMVTSRRGRTVEVHVHPDDLGKVIGRGGRTATALRTLVAGIGGRGIRVDVVDTDQQPRAAMELVAGRVVKPHGITGELVVDVRTDDPDERFAAGNRLRLKPKQGPVREVQVESSRWHGTRLLVRLVGVDDRDGAEALRGNLFVVDSDDLPALDDPDEFYDHELEGLAVRTIGGDEVGKVSEVLHTPAGELLAVRTPAGREVLVPFVSAIVTAVSRDDGLVEIDPPEGLLDVESL